MPAANGKADWKQSNAFVKASKAEPTGGADPGLRSSGRKSLADELLGTVKSEAGRG